MTLSIIAMIVVVLAPVAFPNPDGSPSCALESMKKMSNAPLRNPNITFQVDAVPLRQFVPHAGPDLYRVSIVASDPGYTFKGFLLFAEDVQGQRVGQWLNVGESRAKVMNVSGCDEGNTLTHFDSEPKRSGLLFTFQAPVPTLESPQIKIRCGVVCSVDEWYMAGPILLNGNMDAAKAFMNATLPGGGSNTTVYLRRWVKNIAKYSTFALVFYRPVAAQNRHVPADGDKLLGDQIDTC